MSGLYRTDAEGLDECLRLMFPHLTPDDFRTDGGNINMPKVRALWRERRDRALMLQLNTVQALVDAVELAEGYSDHPVYEQTMAEALAAGRALISQMKQEPAGPVIMGIADAIALGCPNCQSLLPCACPKQEPAAGEPNNPWKEAVLDHLAAACIDAPLDEPPYRIIGRILDWHVAVATDPAVNGGFKLVPVAAPPSPQVRTEPDAQPTADGVPPFDQTQPCDLERITRGLLKKGDPMPTMCMRCHNPHHACDHGMPDAPGVKGPEHD